MGIKNELIAEIKDFLRIYKIAPTTFGSKCMNNPAFISRLMDPDGRITDATIDRVRVYIRKYRRKASTVTE
jgi:hypothetical protein